MKFDSKDSWHSIQSGGKPHALQDARARTEAAFTMIEIAFSLAIVAFVL